MLSKVALYLVQLPRQKLRAERSIQQKPRAERRPQQKLRAARSKGPA